MSMKGPFHVTVVSNFGFGTFNHVAKEKYEDASELAHLWVSTIPGSKVSVTVTDGNSEKIWSYELDQTKAPPTTPEDPTT